MSAQASKFRTPLRLFGIAVLVVAAFVAGTRLNHGGESSMTEHAHQEPSAWTCSMHPQIELPTAGQCPICFMDLIPQTDGFDLDEEGPILQMSPAAAALAEVRTALVERRFVDAEIRLLGRVEADESLTRSVAARVDGRLDTLFVDVTGVTVRRGQDLASIYSPDLNTAQAELLSALHAAEAARDGDPSRHARATATLEAARDRLRLLDVDPALIEARGEARDHVRLTAPFGGVVARKHASQGDYVKTGQTIYTISDLGRIWVELEAYESDLPWLRVGQTATFTVEALPGREYEGRVVFIDPVLNTHTRTVAVRIEVDNRDQALKPGLFVHAKVSATLTAEGTPLLEGEDAEAPLVIPASAPLLTGRRAVVYVQLPDREAPTFEGREVVLGPRAGDHYLVAGGLHEGERVVVRGNFKIDSALQIQARPSMMNPGDEMAAEPSGSGGDQDPDRVDVPPAFRAQLAALLDAYLGLQSALADDDDPGSARAAEAVVAALEGVDGGLLEADAEAVWRDDLLLLHSAAATVATDTELAPRRESFEPLSDGLWLALARYGVDGDATLRLFHCPMAGEDGANWIQLETVTANPYYGDAMLRCGSQTDTLSTIAGNSQ